MEHKKNDTRIIEERLAKLFCKVRPFSENLLKWEDPALPDKYDHNCFEYIAQPARDEFDRALAHQKELNVNFIKLEGDEPLKESFGLEEEITLTMVLKDSNANWKLNDNVLIKKPLLSELEGLELKHFGPVYGEDFALRNVRRLYEKLEYHGAYIDENLVGAVYCFSSDGMTCIDGLIVDEDYRKQYIATSLIAHIKQHYPESVIFLHASADDTPKDMYMKMGFEITDYLFEYTCSDIQKLSNSKGSV